MEDTTAAVALSWGPVGPSVQLTAAESKDWLARALGPSSAADKDASPSRPVVLPRQAIHAMPLLSSATNRWTRRRLASLPVFSDHSVAVGFTRRPQQQLGIRLVLLAPEESTARHGATVGTVDVDSLCWRAGLQAGDLICSIACAATGGRVGVADGHEALEVLGRAHGLIELSVRRRRWSDADRAAVRLQATWRALRVRFRIDDLSRAALLLQLRWREHARRRRQTWELAGLNPSVLAAARLSHSSVGSSSRPSARESRDSSSSSGSKASRRESFTYSE